MSGAKFIVRHYDLTPARKQPNFPLIYALSGACNRWLPAVLAGACGAVLVRYWDAVYVFFGAVQFALGGR